MLELHVKQALSLVCIWFFKPCCLFINSLNIFIAIGSPFGQVVLEYMHEGTFKNTLVKRTAWRR